jgi:hypothetical protein
MAVIAPVLVEVGIASSTVVVVEASIVPSVVDPATAVVGDSVTGVVVGAEGTAAGPSLPPHAPASREKSAMVQSARTSLIIPQVFQDEAVGGFLHLVVIAPAHEPIDKLPAVPDPPNGGLVASEDALNEWSGQSS